MTTSEQPVWGNVSYVMMSTVRDEFSRTTVGPPALWTPPTGVGSTYRLIDLSAGQPADTYRTDFVFQLTWMSLAARNGHHRYCWPPDPSHTRASGAIVGAAAKKKPHRHPGESR